MKTAIFISLVAASVLITTGANARERAFRRVDPAALQPERMSSLCTFKALQTSGYRAAAGDRKICYFDCEGVQAAIMITVDKYCSQDQAVLIHGRPETRQSPAGRSRMKVELSRAAP
jgi:hypothetical protein